MRLHYLKQPGTRKAIPIINPLFVYLQHLRHDLGMVWEHAAITLFAFEEEARGGRGRNQIRYLTVLPYVRLHLSSIQSRSDPTMVPLLICMWENDSNVISFRLTDL